jgi:hypothetical protein
MMGGSDMPKMLFSTDFNDFLVSRYMSERADSSDFSDITDDDIYDIGDSLTLASNDCLRLELSILIDTGDSYGLLEFFRDKISSARDERAIRKAIESGDFK